MKKSSALPFARRRSSIIQRIFRWYSRSARKLPWRGERNPYRILLSEVMLQQTQVSRVLEKYPQFLKRFPDFTTLARAKTSSVIRAWKGMGYNNRAVRLQQLARTVNGDWQGRLPRTVEQLQSLPGIGKYTAHALACLAFNQRVPVVDTNVNRVLGRLFPAQAKRMDIWKLAELTLPKQRADEWNQALMDLGSTLCNSSSPKCDTCPVLKLCPSSFRTENRSVKSITKEPSRDGLPNRIYRGRVVEVLRHSAGGKFIAAKRLGRQIKNDFSAHDEKWLVQLMKGLEKDGLIVMKLSKNGFGASLPR
jgi:A/G-specific adenine glycosylase